VAHEVRNPLSSVRMLVQMIRNRLDGVGDLRGLIERLDYLNDGVAGQGDDLEVDAIWLMPIFESPSYHGYDTTDYLTVEPDYGTNGDLADLLDIIRVVRVLCDIAHKMQNHMGNLPAAARSGAPVGTLHFQKSGFDIHFAVPSSNLRESGLSFEEWGKNSPRLGQNQ